MPSGQLLKRRESRPSSSIALVVFHLAFGRTIDMHVPCSSHGNRHTQNISTSCVCFTTLLCLWPVLGSVKSNTPSNTWTSGFGWMCDHRSLCKDHCHNKYRMHKQWTKTPQSAMLVCGATSIILMVRVGVAQNTRLAITQTASSHNDSNMLSYTLTTP